MKGEDFPAMKFEVRTGYTSRVSMPLTEGIIGFSIKSCCQVLHNTSDNLIRVHGSKVYKPHVFSIPPHHHRQNLGYLNHSLSPRTLRFLAADTKQSIWVVGSQATAALGDCCLPSTAAEGPCQGSRNAATLTQQLEEAGTLHLEPAATAGTTSNTC